MNTQTIKRCRHWYGKLLRLYAKPYHDRFGESMEQTFTDMLQARAAEGRGLFAFTLWLFLEASAGIIRENGRWITMQHKTILRYALATAFLLLVPLVAMQFTDEVAWSLADFVVAGVLLFGAGLAYELVARKGTSIAYRVAVGLAVASALLLVWANGAVGLIGNEENPANLMYFCVLAVGLAGTFLARFQPQGMARALFATAFAQAMVAVIALASGMHLAPGSSVSEVVYPNGFFVMLFVVSALLFRHAAGEKSQQAQPG